MSWSFAMTTTAYQSDFHSLSIHHAMTVIWNNKLFIRTLMMLSVIVLHKTCLYPILSSKRREVLNRAQVTVSERDILNKDECFQSRMGFINFQACKCWSVPKRCYFDVLAICCCSFPSQKHVLYIDVLGLCCCSFLSQKHVLYIDVLDLCCCHFLSQKHLLYIDALGLCCCNSVTKRLCWCVGCFCLLLQLSVTKTCTGTLFWCVGYLLLQFCHKKALLM